MRVDFCHENKIKSIVIDVYNFSTILIWNSMNALILAVEWNKKEALKFLERSLKNNVIEIDFILEDEDWQSFLKDEDFLN